MSEDNVIRPIFGLFRNGPVQSIENAEPVDVILGPSSLEDDVEYYVSHLELVLLAHQRGDEMTDYLFDVIGYRKTDSSIGLRRPIVKTYSLEQFCDRLLRSSRAEWKAQPAFFGALFLELDARHAAIMSVIEERDSLMEGLSSDELKILLQLIKRAAE